MKSMPKKRSKSKMSATYPQFQIFEFESDRLLSPEFFADKESAVQFGERYLSSHDYMVEDRSTPPVAPVPPPAYSNNVVCLATFRAERKIVII